MFFGTQEALSFGEYRWLKVSLGIGGSVARLRRKFAGPFGRRSLQASQPPPPAGRFFVSHNGGLNAWLNEALIVQRSHISSAAMPIHSLSVAREKMSRNRITYDLSKPSWLTLIKIKAIRLALLLAVASGPASAGPMTGSENGCGSCDKDTAACHVPMSKASAATGHAHGHRRLPVTKDDWPAEMILGNAELMLAFRHRLNA